MHRRTAQGSWFILPRPPPRGKKKSRPRQRLELRRGRLLFYRQPCALWV